MEIRKGNRYNTGNNIKSMNKKSSSLKMTPSSLKNYEPYEKDTKEGFNFKSHPASKYIRATSPSKN